MQTQKLRKISLPRDVYKRQALGIDEEDMDYSMGVMAAMLVQAANGNVNAAKFLRDTAGQNPTQQLQEKEFAYRKKQDREAKKAEEDGGMTGGLSLIHI